jgi:hypothetical protein
MRYELKQQGSALLTGVARSARRAEPATIMQGQHAGASVQSDRQMCRGGALRAAFGSGDQNDPALEALLRRGHGRGGCLSTWRAMRTVRAEYLEARAAGGRLNLLGGHGTNAETPEQFRKKDGPWKGAEPGEFGQGVAIFGDEPTPFQGLRPEIADGYLAIWNDPNSKPDDLIAYAKANGFEISESDTRKRFEQRFKDGDVPDSEIDYAAVPRPLIDPGDGAVGAGARGLADPFNFIDELGAIADTLGIPSPGAGGPRETIFNSDRRFGDVLWNNIDQNRAIIGHDEEHHFGPRLGGQIASAIAIPVVGIRNVGLEAGKRVLQAGGSALRCRASGALQAVASAHGCARCR